MTDGQLPVSLRLAIDALMDGIPQSALQAASDHLSSAYRRDAGRSGAIRSSFDRLAYIATRLPATFSATKAALGELRYRCPDLKAESLLELGAGPATGLWAAHAVFSELVRATHIETDHDTVELGQQLLRDTGISDTVTSSWYTSDIAEIPSFEGHDLVLMAYVLGELSETDRHTAVSAAWEATREALVIVEPGTSSGSARILAVREWLIDEGGELVAPCPHTMACPLPEPDWCHFAARLNRSKLQRRLKGGTLAFEDEKFSYLVVTRKKAERCRARVLRRPEHVPHRVRLQLCATNGVRTEEVRRRSSSDYRSARKVQWGDAWNLSGSE